MKIQIEQHEVEAAVREYMANQGIKVEGKTLSVEFKMTRADGGGLVANLIIEDAAPVAASKAAPKARAGTVGAAVAAQAEKASNQTQTTGTVNKLPTAAEAIAEAQAKAAEANQESAIQQTAAVETATTETSNTAEQAAEAGAGGEAKTTTSLFG